MALDNAKNFAKVTVSTGYNSSATSIVLTTGHGAKLPTVPFNVVWWNSTDYADPADDPNVEIVRVTARSTDTLTVTRAQEGTTGTNKNTGGKTYKMIAGLTAKGINDDMPSGGGASSFVRAFRNSSNQAITTNNAKVQFNAETYDPDGLYDASTNYVYTAPSDGYYLIHSQLFFSALDDTAVARIRIFVEGAEVARNENEAVGNSKLVNVTDTRFLNEGDEVHIDASSGDTNFNVFAGTQYSYFTVAKLA